MTHDLVVYNADLSSDNTLECTHFCQAQFKSSSSSVKLRTETGLIITVRPTHPTHPPHPTPDKYIASTQEAEIWYAS